MKTDSNEWFKSTTFWENIYSYLHNTIDSDILPENHLILYHNYTQITTNNALSSKNGFCSVSDKYR